MFDSDTSRGNRGATYTREKVDDVPFQSAERYTLKVDYLKSLVLAVAIATYVVSVRVVSLYLFETTRRSRHRRRPPRRPSRVSPGSHRGPARQDAPD